MRYRSCDVFGSPEEVQVDRHASRLVEGEGEPKLSTPCLPPRPHQPRRLLHQDPSRLPPHSRPSLPSRHPLPPSTSTHPHPPQPHRNPPTTRPIQSSECSQRQGPTFPSITLAFPRGHHFIICFSSIILALPFTICVSPCILNRGPDAPAHRSPTNAPWVHHLLSCLAFAFVICLTSFLH